MSVEHVKGNILDFPNNSNVIAHGCNTLGVMGAGLAVKIKDEYPRCLRCLQEGV